MTQRHTHRIQRTAAGLLAATALATGLMASTSSMAAATGFDSRMNALIDYVKADPSYKRIPLDKSTDREWFYNETEALYTKKISKEQFVSDGAKQFPGYEASFSTVADFITK